MSTHEITQNVKKIIQKTPPHVQIIAAVKTRTVPEIQEAIDAGIRMIGQNYVQDGLNISGKINSNIEMHFIGHLQTNKVKKAIQIFDMIQTLDSVRLALEIHKRCIQIGKVMPVLIEVNSGSESQKAGIFPENIENFIHEISHLTGIHIRGLMTMGPITENPEDARPFFTKTFQLFNLLRSNPINSVEMDILSMGMSDTCNIAVQEGANMIRIGTAIFGGRT